MSILFDMKKQLIYITALSVLLGVTSCFKENEFDLGKIRQAEFNLAVTTKPAAGVTYPVFTVTRSSGSPSLQINLTGPHLGAAEDLKISLDTIPAVLLTGKTVRAEAGVHFDLNGNKVTLKADTSFTKYTLTFKNDFPVRKDTTAVFVIRLDGSSSVSPSENYRRIGLRVKLD